MKNKSVQISNLTPLLLKKIIHLIHKDVIEIFVRCSVYDLIHFAVFVLNFLLRLEDTT